MRLAGNQINTGKCPEINVYKISLEITIASFQSDRMATTCGVPQGSVLGLCWFTLYATLGSIFLLAYLSMSPKDNS